MGFTSFVCVSCFPLRLFLSHKIGAKQHEDEGHGNVPRQMVLPKANGGYRRDDGLEVGVYAHRGRLEVSRGKRNGEEANYRGEHHDVCHLQHAAPLPCAAVERGVGEVAPRERQYGDG